MIGGSDAATELAALRPWADPAQAICADERRRRIERARELTRNAGADVLLVAAGASLNYFLGINWRPSERLVALMVTAADVPVLVAPRFEEGALAAVTAIDVDVRFWDEHESPFDLVADVLRNANATSIAVDPALPYGMVSRLARATPSMQSIEASYVIDGCRMIKSAAELRLMRQAKRMTLEAQRCAARVLRQGIGSGEVARFIDDAHRALGAAGSTFCIVQFGRSSAYPHGLPGERRLADGDVVLIDTGCSVEGYNSDITRSYVFGVPTNEQRRIWEIEAEAQQAAFDAVRPGVPCETIDAVARSILLAHGLGPGYALPGLPHRTGHGIGLAVHEAPYLVKGDRTPLAPGMCFSNEPSIIVPGKFGIRLEDHFFVTETAAEWFTDRSSSIECPF
jgi:Xaa-Pro dipeptidase